MTDFFTSDHHFYHRNIIDYCHRPFNSVEEMSQFMIARWNQVVNPGDLVYHMGDFGLSTCADLKLILDKLNGRKILIRGNHDRHTRTAYMERVGFIGVYDNLEVRGLKLCHYPSFGDNPIDEGYERKRLQLEESDWLICGHIHDQWRLNGRQLNVGVDVNEYCPLSVEKVLEEIKYL